VNRESGASTCLFSALAARSLEQRRRAVVPLRVPASGNNSVVECDLAKVEVAGSNPVSRSIFLIVGVPCTPTGALHSADASPSAPFCALDGRADAARRRDCALRYVGPIAHSAPRAGSSIPADVRSPSLGGQFSLRPNDTLLSLFIDAAGNPRSAQFRAAPSPSGKAELCKSSIPGSNPGGASNFTGFRQLYRTDFADSMRATRSLAPEPQRARVSKVSTNEASTRWTRSLPST
jgi:hypothetical protein